MSSRFGYTLLRYLIAVFAVALTIPVKLAFQPWLETGTEREAPFILSLAAVMFAGWYGGLGPALLATAIAGVSGSYFFMHPFNDFKLASTAQRLRLSLFLIEGSLISVLCHLLKSAQRRAEANEAEARDLQRQLLDTTDVEQRRIGHDLHDGLGQHLTGIAFLSKLIEQRLAARQHPEAETAHKISGHVNKAIGWTKDLARGLAPIDLDREEGLAMALRQLTDSSGEMYRTECRFEVQGEIPVRDMTAAVHLYRIAQEALNNAIRHASPKRIVVRLTREAHRATITVEDDGKGIDADAGQESEIPRGMGLRIMGYRAKMIGGRLEVRRRPGGGTAVTCTCPLPAAVRKGEPTSTPQLTPNSDEQLSRQRERQQQGQGAAG